MADNLRLLEILCGIVAVVFVIDGVRVCFMVDADDSIRRNMTTLSRGLFCVLLNTAAALCAFKPAWPYVSYFGYLVTWTGRACHFLYFGFLLLATVCLSGDLVDCLEDGSVYEQVILLASVTAICLGVILLALRCTVLPGHQLRGDTGQSIPLNALSGCAAIASVGIVIFGLLLFWSALNSRSRYYKVIVREGFNAGFILVSGLASLVSCLSVSPTVSMLFGFLYHGIGRGLFYMITGFYMYPQIPVNHDSMSITVCYVCSLMSIFVGVVHMVLYFFGVSGGGCHSSQTRVTYTTRQQVVSAPMWQQPTVQASYPQRRIY